MYRPQHKEHYKLFEGISQFLPDLNFTFNVDDYPIIFVPYAEKQRLIQLGKDKRCELELSA